MNKKSKILFAVLAGLLIISIIGGVVGIVLTKMDISADKTVSTMGYGSTGEPKELTDREKMVGFVSVSDYGANGRDKVDDTDAFEKAISKNIAVYVPSGTYYISRPLAFNDQNFYGDGGNKSVIISTLSDVKLPIVYVGGSTVVSDLTLSFEASAITGEEKRDERVAVSCGAAVGFGAGGVVRDVVFENVGTAVRSDNSKGFGSNSCIFERIEIKNVSYSGFDFTVKAGYGNIFSRINITNSKAKSAFNFDGEGGTDTLEQITLTDCEMECGIGYTELSGVIIDEPTLKNTKFSKSTLLCTDK